MKQDSRPNILILLRLPADLSVGTWTLAGQMGGQYTPGSVCTPPSALLQLLISESAVIMKSSGNILVMAYCKWVRGDWGGGASAKK